MDRVFVDFDQDVPRYECTVCHHCESIMGKSLCYMKNRGCCWYYPKFTLIDIQRMSKSIDGLQVLDSIKQKSQTIIYPYHIHAKGYFDQSGYNEYLENGELPGEGIVEDQTIFFRACPFVQDGFGCTLPPRYRTIVCNFFICDDILGNPALHDLFKPYIEERARYARWLEWENTSLKHILCQYKVNLVENFDSTIKILQDIPQNIYEFPLLKPVELVDDKWLKGA